MKVLQRIFNFYLNSSIHVALAVVCLTWLTCLEFEIKAKKEVLLFTFFAAVTGYNFVKYYGIAKFYHRSLSGWLKYIQIFSLFSFVAMLFYAIELQWQALLLICVLGMLTFLYAIPFFPKRFITKNAHSLRAISGLKIYIIALVWSVTVVLFPILNNEFLVTNDLLISLLQRFLFVLVLMLPFEIRDMKNDHLMLLTIPQQIGIKRSKLFGVLLLLFVLGLELFKDITSQNRLLVLALICLITMLFLLGSTMQQKKYYAAFWVEAIPMLWLLLFFVLVM